MENGYLILQGGLGGRIQCAADEISDLPFHTTQLADNGADHACGDLGDARRRPGSKRNVMIRDKLGASCGFFPWEQHLHEANAVHRYVREHVLDGVGLRHHRHRFLYTRAPIADRLGDILSTVSNQC